MVSALALITCRGAATQTPIDSGMRVSLVLRGRAEAAGGSPVAAFHSILSGRFGRHVRAHMPAVCKSVWHACLHTLTSGVSAFVPLLRADGGEGNERFPPVASAPASAHLPARRCSRTLHTPNSLASVTGGVTRTRSRTHARTHTLALAAAVLLSAASVAF